VSANGCVEGADDFVIGVDYGTLSARAVVVRAHDGAELGSAVHEYAHGVIDTVLPASGAALPPDWALQDPADYLDALREAVPAAVREAGIDPSQVVGIATDFTASTPLPTLADGTPLCFLPELAERPHAYPKLWKHHAAQPQADRVNAVGEARGEPWLARYGGRISSEWEFAKALQVLDEDPEIYDRTERWIEAADWIVWQLCGREVRDVCTTGYKAIYQDAHFASEDYLRALDERFASFLGKLDGPLGELGARAGSLTAETADRTGLPEGIAVAVGNVDAHVTAPAARAIDPGQMLMVMGTSTCHIMNGDHVAEVPGMCGVVKGGVVPDLWATRPGRAGSATSSPGSSSRGCRPPTTTRRAAAASTYTPTCPSWPARARRRARPARARLAQRQPFDPRRPRAQRSGRRPHAGHAAGAGLSRAAGGDGLRHAQDHRGLRGRRRARARADRRRRPDQEPGADADLRRRHAPAHPPDRLGAGTGARVGDARRGGRRRARRHPSRGDGDGQGAARRLLPDEARAAAYDGLYAHYSALHDQFGANGLMHELRRMRIAA
jgi:L-ribulokinase